MSNRACDPCRRRKTKCDLSPDACSNCRISGLECTYLTPPKKRGPKPSSVRRSRLRSIPLPPQEDSNVTNVTRSPVHNSSLTRGDWHQLVGIKSHVAASPSSATHSPGDDVQSSTPRSIQPIHTRTWPNSHFPDHREELESIRGRLVSSLHDAVPARSPHLIVNEIITLHLEFMFPISPMSNESALRQAVDHFFPPSTVSEFVMRDNDKKTHLASLKTFARLTGLCAHTATSTPETLLSLPSLVADHFLEASRDCLKLFEDYDIEHPSFSSIAIRLSHSGALHNRGHTAHSWHILGQAILIAQELHLHEERSATLQIADPLEAQLLQTSFWVLYMANRSAAVLNNRPILLRRSVPELVPDTLFVEPNRIPLLNAHRPSTALPYEERVLVGTNLCYRLWSIAADLIERIQQHTHIHQNENPNEHNSSLGKMMQSYVAFTGILDDLPPWLQSPDTVMGSAELDAESAAFQRGTFWRLRVDLLVTFHALRMVLLRRCAANGLVAVIGLSHDPLMLEMRTAEIARDCLDAVSGIPFEYLQVNGEPLMEKFRQIGSALLELSQKTENEMIKARAKAHLTRLLNILVRLDSKTVDELNFGQS